MANTAVHPPFAAAAFALQDPVREQLLPATRAVLHLAERLQRAFGAVAASVEVRAIAGRVVAAASSLERQVLNTLESRSLARLSAPGALSRLRHDLRSPLAAVRGFVDILAGEAAAEGFGNVETTAQRARQAADDALVLVDSLLADTTPSEPVTMTVSVPVPDAIPGRILLVDDDADSRALLTRQLRGEGHDTVAVASATAALQVLGEEIFDVALVDLEMPEMDGRALLAQIVADPRLRDMPVIIVSCADQYAEIVRCIDHGAIDYLVKPVRPELLRARLTSTLLRRRWQENDRTNMNLLASEKAKSDALLHNILPPQVIDRVLAGEHVVADAFESVTILFSDLVGFTGFAAALEPREVVASLDRLFSAFDQLVLRHGVEKIKTIGDAYMAVAGLPTQTTDHAERIAALALDMQATLDEINPSLASKLRMRIGIATGPVVAGVIGTHKIAFDVWGHAVNMAARHESYCEPGRIHVALETAALLRDKFPLQSRGILNIRGRGEVETFYLET